MKNYGLLTRVMLRNMLVSMNPMSGNYADGKKKRTAWIRAILLGLLALGALASVIYLEYLLFKGLRYMRMPILLPGLAIFVSMMFATVMGLFQCLSELFQGKDAPFLAVLPLTSRQVFAARMTTLYVSELAMDALLCLPAFVLYAVGQGSAWPVALTGLPVLLFLPVIPLSVVALLASLLMQVSAFSRHREAITMFLSVVAALAYSLSVTMMNSRNMDMGHALSMLASNEGLLNGILNAFPPALWAAKGLTGNFGQLALFLAVSLACAAGLIWTVGPGYLNQALSSTEKTVSHRKSRGGFSWRSSSAFRALHRLEWQEILRTPSWAYNALLGVVMFPVMICIGFLGGFSRAAEMEGVAGFRQLLAGVHPGYVALVTAGVLAFGAMVNPAVSTAISREGGRWPFALTLPVRQRTRFLAKLAVGMEINAVCIILIAAVAWFLVRMPILWLLAALAVAMMIGFASAALSLWVDGLRPQLSWATEMEAIKKNFNQVIGMMLWMVLTALCVIPAVLLWDRGGGIALAGVAGVGLLECVAAMLLLNRATEKNTVLPE